MARMIAGRSDAFRAASIRHPARQSRARVIGIFSIGHLDQKKKSRAGTRPMTSDLLAVTSPDERPLDCRERMVAGSGSRFKPRQSRRPAGRVAKRRRGTDAARILQPRPNVRLRSDCPKALLRARSLAQMQARNGLSGRTSDVCDPFANRWITMSSSSAGARPACLRRSELKQIDPDLNRSWCWKRGRKSVRISCRARCWTPRVWTLIPDWKDRGAPITTEVTGRQFLYPGRGRVRCACRTGRCRP
jgi:hypothetical protein